MTARILVVDDQPLNLKLLEAKLAAEYYDVVTAPNGVAALELAAQERPDLVITDVMMPGMDGFEVCRRLKDEEATAHVPVVIVTALNEAQDRVMGLEAGADDFLTRPVNDTALFARVRSLLRLKMTHDELRLRLATGSEFGYLPMAAEIMRGIDDPAGNILLIEDFPPEAADIEEILSRVHRVRVAANDRDAMNVLANGDVDLVIASLTLQQCDALRMCSAIRSRESTRHMPIVALVPDDDMERLAKALDLGVNDYAVKPVDRNEIVARVRNQLRRRRYQERLRLDYERSLTEAAIDSLTGLFGRRYLMLHLQRLMRESAVEGHPLSLIIADVDHFKAVNDTHGHLVGDEVLRQVAARLRDHVRPTDLSARYGGEEFVVVMPNASESVAGAVADRLRATIAETPIVVAGVARPLTVTISVGLAEAGATDTAETLLKRADAALYEAKAIGRNRVVVAEPA